jgi:hypothetical protein
VGDSFSDDEDFNSDKERSNIENLTCQEIIEALFSYMPFMIHLSSHVSRLSVLLRLFLLIGLYILSIYWLLPEVNSSLGKDKKMP